MKRSTAIRNLVTVAEAADRHAAMAGLEWPLHQMWVAGEILDGPATLEVVSVILGLDVPADELPWLALHPREQAVADLLRLPKLPIRRYARPIGEPIWNPAFRRVARFWDVTTGLDQQVVEALDSGDPVLAVEPTPDEYARHMTRELTRCRAHLDAVLDGFWERPGGRPTAGEASTPRTICGAPPKPCVTSKLRSSPSRKPSSRVARHSGS